MTRREARLLATKSIAYTIDDLCDADYLPEVEGLEKEDEDFVREEIKQIAVAWIRRVGAFRDE